MAEVSLWYRYGFSLGAGSLSAFWPGRLAKVRPTMEAMTTSE